MTHVHAVSMAPPWVGALLTAMRVPTKNAVQVKKVIEASGLCLALLGEGCACPLATNGGFVVKATSAYIHIHTAVNCVGAKR